jgi:hypothetical protein
MGEPLKKQSVWFRLQLFSLKYLTGKYTPKDFENRDKMVINWTELELINERTLKLDWKIL